jgi:ketosteroid isomerase-like protein
MSANHEPASTDVDVLAGLYAAFARRDLDTIRAAIHPDFVMTQSDVLPWGGVHRGPDGFFAFLGTLLSYTDPTVEIGEIYDSGDHVVQVGHTTGTVRATGTAYRVREVHVWRLAEGRPIGYDVHLDTAAMLAALRGETVA